MAKHFKLFGTLEVIEDGVPSRLVQSSRGCALVSYLIITNEAHSREHLADLLWESTSTAQGLKRLRQLVSRIRPFLPQLQTTRQTLSFQASANTTVDIHLLQNALATNDSSQLERALTLYEGPLLNNFYVENAPRFSEWLLLVQEQWRQRIFDQYRHLSQQLLAQEEWQRGTKICRCWLTLDDLNEEAYRRLMHMLVGLGEFGSALAAFETCRQTLWDTLGVEPEEATLNLAEKIMSQQAEIEKGGRLAAKQTLPPLPDPGELAEPGPLPVRSFIPYHRNNDFTGRECDLLDLASSLLPQSDAEKSSAKAVTISGMGGVGKTQLAVEFCYRYGRFFPGGVYWMNFANPETIVEEIASIGGQSGMGLFQESDQLTLTDRVGKVIQAWQNHIPKLLIFDSCEDETLLAKWLPVTGESRVLVTSQRGYWSPDLSVLQLPLPVMQPAESVALLHKIFPHLNETVAAAIAKEIGDLPLALHLAGSFLRRYRQITPGRYLAQLRQQDGLQHPSLQGHGANYSPTDHKLNVEKTFAINYLQLNPDDEVDQIAQQLLLHTALFAPGEPIQKDLLLSTILPDDLDMMAMLHAEDGLMRLTTLGFLEREGADNIIIHRLIAAFTIQKSENIEAAYLPVIQTVNSSLTLHLEQYSYLGILPLSANHLSTIVKTALDQELTEILQLIPLWTRYLRDNALFDQAQRISQQALTICEKKLPSDHPQTASILFGLGIVNLRQGVYQEAKEQLTRSLQIRERILEPTHQDVAQSYNSLGAALMEMSEFEQARPYIEKTLRIWQQNYGATHPRVAIAMNNLGSLLTDLGKFEDAQLYINKAFKIWKKTNGAEHPLTSHAIQNRGVLLLKQGDYEQARTFFDQALAIREKTLGANHPSTANSMHYLGKILTKLGQYQEAYAFLKQAWTLLEKLFHAEHPALAHVHISLGEWHQIQEEDKHAREHFTQAAVIFEKAGIFAHPDIQETSFVSLDVKSK